MRVRRAVHTAVEGLPEDVMTNDENAGWFKTASIRIAWDMSRLRLRQTVSRSRKRPIVELGNFRG